MAYARDTSRRDLARAGHPIALGLALAVAWIPAYHLFGSAQPWVMLLISGVLLGVASADVRGALAAAAVFALGILTLVGPAFMTGASYLAIGDRTEADFFWSDVISDTLHVKVMLPLARAASIDRFDAILLWILVPAVVGGLAALTRLVVSDEGFRALSRRSRLFSDAADAPERLGHALLWSVTAALVLSAIIASSTLADGVTRRMQDGEYRSDYHIYIRTAQLVADGTGYYDALQTSIEGHYGRIVGDGAYTVPSPRWVRHPFPFYVMGLMYGLDPSGVPVALLILFGASTLMVGTTIERRVGRGLGSLFALAVFPYFAMLALWENAFMPDAWGAAFVMVSFGLLMLDRLEWAVLPASLAMMCRPHFWSWGAAILLALLAYGIVHRKWRPLVLMACGSAVAAASYALHWWVVETRHADILTGARDAFLGRELRWTGLGGLVGKLHRLTNFATTLQTWHWFSGVVFLCVALVVFGALVAYLYVRRRRVHVGIAAAFAYLLLFAALPFVSTHIGYYWSQGGMPLALTGSAIAVLFLLWLLGRAVPEQGDRPS